MHYILLYFILQKVSTHCRKASTEIHGKTRGVYWLPKIRKGDTLTVDGFMKDLKIMSNMLLISLLDDEDNIRLSLTLHSVLEGNVTLLFRTYLKSEQNIPTLKKSIYSISAINSIFPFQLSSTGISFATLHINITFTEYRYPMRNTQKLAVGETVSLSSIRTCSQKNIILQKKPDVVKVSFNDVQILRCRAESPPILSSKWAHNGVAHNVNASGIGLTESIYVATTNNDILTTILKINYTHPITGVCHKLGNFTCSVSSTVTDKTESLNFDINRILKQRVVITPDSNSFILILLMLHPEGQELHEQPYQLTCGKVHFETNTTVHEKSNDNPCQFIEVQTRPPKNYEQSQKVMQCLLYDPKAFDYSKYLDKKVNITDKEMVVSVEMCTRNEQINENNMCEKCPVGQFSNEKSQFRCYNKSSSCPTNYYGYSTICTLCPYSHYSPPLSTLLSHCKDHINQCVNGEFGIEHECKTCPLGTTSTGGDAVKPEDCYTPTQLCGQGFYGWNDICQLCPDSYTSDDKKAVKIEDCYIFCDGRTIKYYGQGECASTDKPDNPIYQTIIDILKSPVVWISIFTIALVILIIVVLWFQVFRRRQNKRYMQNVLYMDKGRMVSRYSKNIHKDNN